MVAISFVRKDTESKTNPPELVHIILCVKRTAAKIISGATIQQTKTQHVIYVLRAVPEGFQKCIQKASNKNTHGTSKKKQPQSKGLELEIANEEQSKINNVNSWIKFATKVEKHKEEIRNIMSNFSKKKIIGFGSSARSQTFLNFCGALSMLNLIV